MGGVGKTLMRLGLFSWPTRLIPPHLLDRATGVWRTLLVAFFLRVLLMPLFASPDAMVTAWVSTVLLSRGQLILSNDPPPIFYVHAAVFGLFRPLIPGNITDFFLNSPSFTPPSLFPYLALRQPGIAVEITLLKLPYLAFDLGVAILLLWVVKDPGRAMTAMKLWAFNPVAIFTSYFMGQFDVVPVFFVLLGFYYYRMERPTASTLALALAILFKIFAIFIAPVFLILYWHRGKDLRTRVRTAALVSLFTVLALGSLFLISALQPVYYDPANMAVSGDYRNGFFGTTLYNRGVPSQPLAQGILTFLGFSARLATTPGSTDAILLLPLAYLVLLLGLVYLRRGSFPHLWSATTVLFLLLYGLSSFHPQWFLWGQPFLLVMAALDRRRRIPLYSLLVGLFFVYLLNWDNGLTTVPLIPVIPGAANWVGPLELINQAGYPAITIVNLGRSLFSGLCLFLAYLEVRRMLRPEGPQEP